MPTGVSNLFLTFNSLVEEGRRENKRGQKPKSVVAAAAAAAAVAVVVVFT